jgi:hypothetical protein
MEPKPWPESRNIPSDATEEVLKKWESASKPRGEHPCRKIVFTIKSKDQGWGGGAGRGTYKESFTWFDTGLERVSAFRESKLHRSPSFLTRWNALLLKSKRCL